VLIPRAPQKRYRCLDPDTNVRLARQRSSCSCFKPKFYLAPHITSRHDTTRSTCRAHAFRLCRACRTTRLDTLDTTSSTESTRSSRRARHVERVVLRRDEPSGIWALRNDHWWFIVRCPHAHNNALTRDLFFNRSNRRD